MKNADSDEPKEAKMSEDHEEEAKENADGEDEEEEEQAESSYGHRLSWIEGLSPFTHANSSHTEIVSDHRVRMSNREWRRDQVVKDSSWTSACLTTTMHVGAKSGCASQVRSVRDWRTWWRQTIGKKDDLESNVQVEWNAVETHERISPRGLRNMHDLNWSEACREAISLHCIAYSEPM